MIKVLRPALFLMMLAIVVISPASVYAAENITINNLPLPLTEGDFFDILPFYVWIIIAIVLLVIIVFIIFLLFGPKKKKGEQAAKGEKRGKKMPADMDKRQRPQADMGQRPQQMPPDMGQASPMPTRPYMNEAAPYPQNSPAAPQMRPPQPAGSPNMSPPQPAQQRPMQPPPSPAQAPSPMQQAPTPMQQAPSPIQQAPSPMQAPPSAQQPQRMPPQPMQARPQPGQPPPPAGQRPAAPQPVQGQPRPAQSMSPGSTGMPPRTAPQPVQPAQGQGMPQRPRPSGTPQPAYPARQQFGTQGPPQMDFMVGNLIVTPMRVKDGQEVSISATVTNRSGSESNYSMVFRINHVVEKIMEMTLGPGASQTETIKVKKENPGDYYVDVDGIRGSFTVVERVPASFSIDGLKISPERIKQGDPVAISFNITNNGERQGVYNASVNIKGISEAMEDITLEGGETKHVTFNIVKDTAGFYPVSVEHLSGRFVVEMDWKGENI
jgi:Sec-independent protein translocase protein TatA